MSKYFEIRTETARQSAINTIKGLPLNGKKAVRIIGARRSLDQNAKMWAILQDFENQATHAGRRFTKEDWKDILSASFLTAKGELDLVPNIERPDRFIAIGLSTSKASVADMADFITYMTAVSNDFGVKLTDTKYD